MGGAIQISGKMVGSFICPRLSQTISLNFSGKVSSRTAGVASGAHSLGVPETKRVFLCPLVKGMCQSDSRKVYGMAMP